MKISVKDLQTGDVLHCESQSNGLESRVVRFCTKSNTTHTATILISGYNIFVLESQVGSGVALKELDEWIERYNYKIKVSRIPQFNRKKFEDTAMDYIGFTGYPLYRLALVFIWHFLTKRWLKKWGNGIYCTELVAMLHGHETPERLAPCDYQDHLKTRTDVINFYNYLC